jgi:probable F420-dependent oxidoreductase
LNFNGKFFRVNLMTPFFSPPRISYPEIPIFVAGVNRRMCRLAGELCEGLHVHPLHTKQYLEEVVVGAVKEGLRNSGRTRDQIQLAASVLIATGNSKQEIENMKNECRLQIAFYASTRTYRPVLELHGWGETCERLHEKSVKGDWAGMASEITDKMMEEFVVEGRWGEVADKVEERYKGIVDRVRLYLPFDGGQNWKKLVDSFH